ncbi:MAG: hypothetical protein ACFFE8_04920 [Candidatus Heimdallarchaeota archaeon]
MNQETLEQFYVTGDYSLLLEEVRRLAYDQTAANLTDIDSIYVSFHSRALIRLGGVNEAETLIYNASNMLVTKLRRA